MPTNVQTLNVEDFTRTRDLDVEPLVTVLGAAVVNVEPTERTDVTHRGPRTITGYRIDFDADLLRNTHAHGYACNRGWIAWISA